MEAIDYYRPEYDSGHDFSEYGEMLVEIDAGEGYDIDISYIFQLGNRYTYLNATGDSSWDGDYSGFTGLTLAQLKKMAKSWKHGDGSELALAKWIGANL